LPEVELLMLSGEPMLRLDIYIIVLSIALQWDYGEWRLMDVVGLG